MSEQLISEQKRKRGRPKSPVLYCRQKLRILRRLELRLSSKAMAEELGWSHYMVSRIESGTTNFIRQRAEEIEDKYGLKKGFFALPLHHVLADERAERTPEPEYLPFKDQADRLGDQWRQVDLDPGTYPLNEREKYILRTRRLLQSVKYRSLDKPATLLELSEMYGISRERVRQIEAHAFEKLIALVQPGQPQIQIGRMQEQRKPKWW
tara:strand:- start:3503 stop:4126 length:624 start_codon:yes stop_codon:yes gene_type:complete